MKVKYGDVEDAFFYVGSAPRFMNSALLDKSTGQIHYRSEMSGNDEIPEELWESGSGVEIPHKNDLDLGSSLVFEFAESQMPDDSDHVRDMFRKKGAYSTYKEFLESRGLIQKWYEFEKEAQERAIRDWCKEHGIELDG